MRIKAGDGLSFGNRVPPGIDQYLFNRAGNLEGQIGAVDGFEYPPREALKALLVDCTQFDDLDWAGGDLSACLAGGASVHPVSTKAANGARRNNGECFMIDSHCHLEVIVGRT